MNLTDTHCHLDLGHFEADLESVLDRTTDAGVTHVLVPSLDLDSSARVATLAARHSILYAAVGVHPTEVGVLTESQMEDLRHLAQLSPVCAIGEIGLDYFWVKEQPQQAIQRQLLRAQLDLATTCGLPVILHMREAQDSEDGPCAEDMLGILKEWVASLRSRQVAISTRPGVLHSFSGSLQTARSALELGFFIGVTGPITFPNAKNRREIVRQLPLERLLIETDSPFLAPVPHRGERNEPAFVAHIADKIAEIQSRTPSEVAQITSRNAARLFSWDKAN